MDLTILNDKYFIGVASGIGGMLLTILVQQILNKRGLLTYFVRHSRVGMSADDAIFGSVRVAWNNQPVPNLFSSTMELVNQSTRDYENISVRVFTNDTVLLTERTEVVGSILPLSWTEEFARQLHVDAGQQPTQAQVERHSRQRHYLVPILNRGQVVRFHFLNAAPTPNQPSLWMDILHRGVKLRFHVPPNEILGVAQPIAAVFGIVLGFVFVGVLITYMQTVWIAALSSLTFGLFAQVPGAYAFKIWRWLRNAFGG